MEYSLSVPVFFLKGSRILLLDTSAMGQLEVGRVVRAPHDHDRHLVGAEQHGLRRAAHGRAL